MTIGQVSRANVSAHNRTRLHGIKVRPGEKRSLVANFNGAVEAARTIATAQWRMDSTCVASLSGGAIAADGRSTSVLMSAHDYGCDAVECIVTFDNGDVYVQTFVVEVACPAVGNVPAIPVGSDSVAVLAS